MNPNLPLAGLQFPNVYFLIPFCIARTIISRTLMKRNMGLDLGDHKTCFWLLNQRTCSAGIISQGATLAAQELPDNLHSFSLEFLDSPSSLRTLKITANSSATTKELKELRRGIPITWKYTLIWIRMQI